MKRFLLLAICASAVCHAQSPWHLDGHLGLGKVNLDGVLTDPYKTNIFEVGVDLVRKNHMFSLYYTSYKADGIAAREKGWPEVKHRTLQLDYTRAISSFLLGFSVGSGSTTQPVVGCSNSGCFIAPYESNTTDLGWSASLGAQISRNLDIKIRHMNQSHGEQPSKARPVDYNNQLLLTWHFRGGHAKPLFGRR